MLPNDQDAFCTSSVAPAGDTWTQDYRRILQAPKVELRCAPLDPTDATSHGGHNIALIDRASALSGPTRERVWIITIGTQPDDLARRAAERGLLTMDLDPFAERPTAFVVMPYGRKKDPRANRYIDCDPPFHRVYRPLLEDLDIDWRRADLETDSGIIHSSMLSDLANSQLAVVDLSTVNFNVAYELGVRHIFAARSTVIVDPRIASFKRQPPPFDINMIRVHSFQRDADAITDEQAEHAIRTLRPVFLQAKDSRDCDGPAHIWFDLPHVKPPFRQLSSANRQFEQERAARIEVAAAIRASDVAEMLAQADRLVGLTDMSASTRRALRIELAGGLLDEKAYADARRLLDLAKPHDIDDPIHRHWLQKSVLAYRRLGEDETDPGKQEQLWEVAKTYLRDAQQAGYGDSETYGMWRGLLKRQLELRRPHLSSIVAQSLFAEMEAKYRQGFESEPSYYTGVNLVMALRWSGRRHESADFDRDFAETVTITRFLARRAIDEDSGDFWPRATMAELALHEALEVGAPIEPAVRLYTDAALNARPDPLKSTRYQLTFLKNCGDDPTLIDTVLRALDEIRPDSTPDIVEQS